MNVKKHIIIFLLIILYPLNSHSKQMTRVKVALVENFSLANTICYDPYGQFLERGVSLAWRDFKRAHPDISFDIELAKYDIADDRLKAIEAIEHAYRDGATAALGFICSDAALLGGRRAQELKLPLITPTATHDDVASIGDYVLMGMFPDSYQGSELAKFAYNDLKKRRTLIISAADCSYCMSLGKSFKKRFTQLGGEIVAEYPVLTKDVEYSKIIKEAKTEEFDLVLLPNYAMQSALIIAEFLKNGLDVVFLGGDGWNWTDETFKIISDTRFKGYSSTSWVVNEPMSRSQLFVEAHKDLYNEEPFTTTSHCYDAAMILFSALNETAHHDRAGLVKSFHSNRKYDGVTGRFIYNGENYPKKTLVILKIQDGRSRIVKIVHPI